MVLRWIELIDVGIRDEEPVDVPDLVQRLAREHPLLAQTHGHACLCRLLHILWRRDTWEVQVLLRDMVHVEPTHRIRADPFSRIIEDNQVAFRFVHRRGILAKQQSVSEERFEWWSVL